MKAKEIFTRSLITLVLASLAGILGHLYFTSIYYTGARTSTSDELHIFDLLIIVTLFVVVKLFIYDLITSSVLKKLTGPFATRVFYIGYALALAIDMVSIYMSFRPIYMNLSLFGTIAYSPVVLFIAIIVLLIGLPLSRNKSSKFIH